MTIRVVLADDNLLVREGVRALLESYREIEVVAFAEDAPSLLAAAAETEPDVVVTDIKMPPHFRLEASRPPTRSERSTRIRGSWWCRPMTTWNTPSPCWGGATAVSGIS